MSRTPSYPRGTPFKAPLATPLDAESVPPASAENTGTGSRIRTRDVRDVRESRAPDAAVQLQELREREARLRRWTARLLLGLAAVVVLAVGVSVYLVQRAIDRLDRMAQAPPATSQPAPADVSASERAFKKAVLAAHAEPTSQPRDTPAPVEKPAAEPPQVEKTTPAEKPVPVEKVVPPAEKLPQQPVPPVPAPPTRDRALEVVGGLTAGHLYQSYLNIGMLADAVENEVYTDGEAKKLLATVTSLMDTVDVQLTRLNEAIEDAEDRKRLGQVRELTALLRAQARELRGYWDVPAKDVELRKQHELKFHKARDAAWGGIKELLGIQEE
ncbi:MAG: hypothetical protein JNM56_40145 [Planctomycetia bacterium]|nr:hypothetical protein [Planctomycetia bacterium]